MKNLRHGIELFFIKLLFSLFSSLDDRSALRLGRLLGDCSHLILRNRNRIAYQNMELCGIGANPNERDKILRKMYRNFGMTIAEFARLKKYSAADFDNKVRVRDAHHLEEAFSHGRGAIFLSGHYDNWELLVQAIAVRGYKTDIVVRQQHNLKADDLINNLRKSENIRVIVAETQPRNIIRALKQGRGVAVLHDVYGGRNGHLIPLFGHPVSTPAGVIEIAVRLKTPVIIGFVRREADGRHTIRISKSLIAGEDESFSSVDPILKYYHEKLEETVREEPGLWLWTHKRFKGVIDYK
jgi:KDO2-lipid IV(A) lauroyltransferase